MDSRNDVYGPDLYREYTRALAEPESLATFLKRIDASFAFLEWKRDPVEVTVDAFRRIGGWSLVYFDDFSIVLVPQDGSWAALAARDAYSLIDPTRYRPGPIPQDKAASFLDEATRAKRQGRGAFIARVMRVNALLELGRRAEALEEEKEIVSADPPLYYIFTYLGILRYSVGDLPEAAAHFRRALALNPLDRASAQRLRRISEQR